MTSHLKRRATLLALFAAIAAVAAGLVATTATASKKATPIKLAILSDCQGAFGAFYEADIGGAQTAFAQYAGGKPKDAKKPSAGMTGITVAGTPIDIVGYGCSNDTADLAIKET